MGSPHSHHEGRRSLERNTFFEEKSSETLRGAEDIQPDHEKAQAFLRALISQNVTAIKDFLVEFNQARVSLGSSSVSRTIVLMDATGSMSGLIQKSKNTVKTMFKRADEVLKENGMNNASFEMQFVVYRNYDCEAEELLQHSGWECDPENLRQFMDPIEASGGTWEPEAVEIGLLHANRVAEETEVAQVILIGDAPPNTRDLVIQGRKEYKGEAYWRGTAFAQSTDVDSETRALADKNIPVHAFYVQESARSSFEQISRATNGQCGALDIDSPAGAEELTRLVTEQVLLNVGGDKKGVELVSAYRAKFCRGFIAPSASNPSTTGFYKQQGSAALVDDFSDTDEATASAEVGKKRN